MAPLDRGVGLNFEAHDSKFRGDDNEIYLALQLPDMAWQVKGMQHHPLDGRGVAGEGSVDELLARR
jgi:hypothetical protein